MQRVAAILAGGQGQRLWPWSRTRVPKQFLSLADGPTFLQQAYGRVAGMACAPEVVVLTAASTVDLVRGQIPGLADDHLLGEPVGRDTAASAALAIALARRLAGGEAVLALLPADHAVFDPERLRAALDLAWEAAEAEGCPVLLGIPPTRPETGYGYIGRGPELRRPVDGPAAGIRLAQVEGFVEKPDLQRAAGYVQSGRYLWNSGVCVCRTDVLAGALALYAPDLADLVESLRGRSPAELPAEELAARLRGLVPISLDYAVLERLERALVLEVSLAWDDVGSWEALSRLHPQDELGNVALGDAVLSDTQRTVIYGEPGGRLVVTHGVRDLVVVDTADSLLIAERGSLSGLKQALGEVRASRYAAHLDDCRPAAPAVQPRAWGHVFSVPGHETEILSLAPGAEIPAGDLQGRAVRLVSGQACVLGPDGPGLALRLGRERRVPPGQRVASATGALLALAPPVSADDGAQMLAPEASHQVSKPWGRETWWAVSPQYVGKRIEVVAGAALSLQFHECKHETLYVQSGEVLLRLGETEHRVGPGHVAVVPPETVHRIMAVTDAVLFEVSTPEVDDVVRLEDRYGRGGPAGEAQPSAVAAG